MPITHAKVSGKSDGADATQIQPSDWNDEHVGSGGGLPPQWTDGGNGDVTATTDDVAKTAFTIKKLTGQTGSLLAVDDENDVTILELERHIDDTSYRLYIERGLALQVLQVTENVDGDDVYWALTIDSVDYQLFDVFVDPNDAANNYTIAKFIGWSTQNPGMDGPILSVENENGQLFGVNGDGEVDITGPIFAADAEFAKLTAFGPIVVGSTSAPADGDIDASTATLWFDDTNGAAALKIKGKSADGTVVTATVPLT